MLQCLMTGCVEDGVFAPTDYYWLFDEVVNADLEPKDDMALTAALVPLAFAIMVAFCLATYLNIINFKHSKQRRKQALVIS